MLRIIANPKANLLLTYPLSAPDCSIVPAIDDVLGGLPAADVAVTATVRRAPAVLRRVPAGAKK